MDETPKAPWALTTEALAKVQKPPPEPPEPVREEEPREAVVDLRRTTGRDVLIAAAFALAAVVSVISTYRGIGWSWDEAFYRAPAQMTVEWLGGFLNDKSVAVTREKIEQLWAGEENIGIIELPSVVKWSMGLSWTMTRKLWGEMRAFRFPAALAFGLSAFLIYLLTLNSYRRRAAVIAAVAFITMPNVFGHAHIAATETITNAVILLALYCWFRGLNSPVWSILFGIAYGIALDTKINTLLLAPVLLVWGHLFHHRRYINNFFCMIFIAPVVWIALWPWLWYDTFLRLGDYIHYFSQHSNLGVLYQGRVWGGPLATLEGRPYAPWHYPIVMTLITVPLPVLLLSVVGLARTAVHCRWEYRGILFTAYAVAVLFHAALPGSPKYDGTRLFFSLMPMLAILTGGGADSLVTLFPFNRKIRGELDVRYLVAAAFALVIAANGVWAISRIHPHELSYYNVLTGGIEGAQGGFEVTYWGEAVNDELINKALNQLPKGARIRPMALNETVFNHLQEWGLLRDDLRFDTAGRYKEYDYFLLQARRGFFGPAESYLFDLAADLPPEQVFGYRNVPFIVLFSRENAGELANQ